MQERKDGENQMRRGYRWEDPGAETVGTDQRRDRCREHWKD